MLLTYIVLLYGNINQMIINPTFSDENSNFINEYNHISFLSIELP